MPADKDAMTSAIAKTREAAKADNPEAIKAALSQLEAASHAFSKSLYERARPAPSPGPIRAAPPSPSPAPERRRRRHDRRRV